MPGLAKDPITVKHIDIDDDPTEDILYHLGSTCDWMDAALHSSSLASEAHDMDSVDRNHCPGVLVHCTQGMSRSGSFIVAYCKLVCFLKNRVHSSSDVGRHHT
jgi:dual specificity phosphatase 12